MDTPELIARLDAQLRMARDLDLTVVKVPVQLLRDAAHALSGATPTGKEMVQLIADHSVALEFLREIASGECPIGCGNCIICRTKAWLFTEREASVSPSSEGEK